MRLLTFTFSSADQFLRHYSDEYEGGALFYRTKTETEPQEDVLLEVAFPQLPNRMLLRGYVLGPKEDGIWVAFNDSDASTRDFLLKIAQGDLEITQKAARAHDRFPTDVPVSYKPAAGDGDIRHARAVDIAVSAMFVRTDEPPDAGEQLELVIGPIGEEAETFTVRGEVSNQRDQGDHRGFAVRFDNKTADGPRLRRFLRNASETGRVSL